MKYAFLCCIAIFCLFSTCTFAQGHLDTLKTLNTNNYKGASAIYKAPNGKHYEVSFQNDPFEKPMVGATVACGATGFAGSARAQAKTTYVNGQPISFNTIADLIKALTPDNTVRKKLNTHSPRIADEMKNVSLSNGIYLFAIKNESDHDYHIIIGDNKDYTKATLFNVEISGLPAVSNPTIQQVRTYFEKNFVQVCGPQYAVFTKNPIPITIGGSVFYDVDHQPGQIGPVGLQPKTSWEIHPIATIAIK